MSPSFATLVISLVILLVILQCVFMDNPDDLAAGIETTTQFKRFSQRNDVFSRAFWDDTVRSAASQAFFGSYRMEATPRRGDGFTQKDFALRNASWLISDIMTDRFAADGRREGFQAPISNDTPVAGEKLQFETPGAAAANIKKAARFFGADLCGVTEPGPAMAVCGSGRCARYVHSAPWPARRVDACGGARPRDGSRIGAQLSLRPGWCRHGARIQP